MSSKQQLAELVASLPESDTLEQAFDRLYKAFKEKLRRQGTPPPAPSEKKRWDMILGSFGSSDEVEFKEQLDPLESDPALERSLR